jgi:hypothetical protein
VQHTASLHVVHDGIRAQARREPGRRTSCTPTDDP